jgi:DNA adenine methylase
VVLGDFNKEPIAFHNAIGNHPRAPFNQVTKFPVSASFYNELRSWDPNKVNAIEAAARSLYLNRFCFNGVYRTNRNGQFNVPIGTKTGRLPSLKELCDASSALQGAICRDADFLTTIADARKVDFVYLDPSP